MSESRVHLEDLSYSFQLHCAICDLLTFICIYLGQHVQLGSSTRSEITDDEIITLCNFFFLYFQNV